MYVHTRVHTYEYVYLPMKDHLDDTGSSPQIHVNSEDWIYYYYK